MNSIASNPEALKVSRLENAYSLPLFGGFSQ